MADPGAESAAGGGESSGKQGKKNKQGKKKNCLLYTSDAADE